MMSIGDIHHILIDVDTHTNSRYREVRTVDTMNVWSPRLLVPVALLDGVTNLLEANAHTNGVLSNGCLVR